MKLVQVCHGFLVFQMRKLGFKYFTYPGANISVDEL